MEIWKDVVGFEGIYAVSSLGRIMRVARSEKGRKPGTIKKPGANRHGYLGTQLAKDGKNYTVRVHRVVSEAFIGPVPAGYEVNHKDGDKSNNHADNLEYVTHSQNIAHSYNDLGREHPCGSLNKYAKLTEADIPLIRQLHADGWSQRAIGDRFGVRGTTIWYVLNGRTWAHVK